MIVLVFGAPGSGKTTLARYLGEKLGLSFISVGGMLREMAKTDPSIGDFVNSGRLMPNAKVDELLFARFNEVGGNVILDGYPRTLDQAESFFSFIQNKSLSIDRVYRVHVPVEKIVERSLERGRVDDTPEIIRDRHEVYHQQTEMVLQFFKNTGQEVIEIDNSRSEEDAKRQIDESLKKS